MMQMRDWISGFIGLIVFAVGLASFWSRLSFINDFLPAEVLRWVVLASGAYLLWNSVIEITNSNVVGWWSLLGVAVPSIIVGILPFLGFGLFAKNIYGIILLAVGFFLMVATFAMEL